MQRSMVLDHQHKNFYIDTPMADPEYVRIKITDIPKEFILEYDLAGKEDHNGWIYFGIRRDCYGLPQAGILANDLLCGRLEKEGYYKLLPYQAFGNTNGSQFSFVSLSMILTLSMWASSTSSISPWSCNGTTKSNQYGRQQDCRLKCPMGFPQQASMHRHEILCQQPIS
jgi:hypothetical protein